MVEIKHFPEFKTIFNHELLPFVRFHGFDVVAFNDWLKVPDNMSTYDFVRENYDESAVLLIKEMLSTSEPENINTNLAHIKDGKEHKFNIAIYSKGFYSHLDVRIGLIYYPFAIEKVSRTEWNLHHLPTGLYVYTVKGKKNAVELVQKCQSINGMDAVDYTQAGFEELSKLVREDENGKRKF